MSATAEVQEQKQEEDYELVYNPRTKEEVKITVKNSFGRKCEKK